MCSLRMLYQLYVYQSENWRCQKAATEWHDLHLIFSVVNRYHACLSTISTMVCVFCEVICNDLQLIVNTVLYIGGHLHQLLVQLYL